MRLVISSHFSDIINRRGRPPKNKKQTEEVPVNNEETEVNIERENEEEELRLEPVVVNAIYVEVRKILKDILPPDRTKAKKETTKEGPNDEGDKVNSANKEQDEDEVLIINVKGKGSGTKGPKGCDYKAFKGCNPPPFDGKKDAVATCHWISAMEAVIDISECRVDQAVKFAAHAFTEKALHWWNTVKQSKTTADVECLKWEDLKELVTKHFCPKNEIDKIEREFLTLKAGRMNHRQYTSKFNEMSRLVPYLVNTEERRMKLYVEGLPPRVRTHVKAHCGWAKFEHCGTTFGAKKTAENERRQTNEEAPDARKTKEDKLKLAVETLERGNFKKIERKKRAEAEGKETEKLQEE
ncbi:hypothetical protein E3N88_07887 [Mikania micrantha]|uniref:Retrotransposon gag domain-containing protein n=1 Tax=Mikania micrantha TaxID=192012 RepID=A0A5N6PF38_9ASTR|nr:hypothetical protein E3N88_07887 [Mikania micrantha]